jgi:hypothetical protein
VIVPSALRASVTLPDPSVENWTWRKKYLRLKVALPSV